MEKTLFTKIIEGEIKADVVYRDEQCIAFHDINPQAPVHVLIVPNKVIPRLSEAQPEDLELLGHLMTKVNEVAKLLGVDDFRVVINNGIEAGQTVFHLHLHLLAGRSFDWPPG